MHDTSVALLLYIGKIGRKWGCRTPLGDRVVASTELITYEEARAEVRRILAEEQASGTKHTKPEAEAPVTFGDAWDQYLSWAEASGKTSAAIRNIDGFTATLSDLVDKAWVHH